MKCFAHFDECANNLFGSALLANGDEDDPGGD